MAWIIVLAGAALFARVAVFGPRSQRAALPPSAASPAARAAASTPRAAPPRAAAPALPASTVPPSRPPIVAEVRPTPRAEASLSAPRSTPPRERAPLDLLRPEDAAAARPRRRPQIAIILDDVGADLAAVDRALRLPGRLTFAIIPYLAHSQEAARRAHRRGFEVMLHLPMEPLGYPREDPGRGAILQGMPSDQIRRSVLESLASVPHVRGINNHMGSRITADPRPMRAVMETIAATPYYFIDSRTSDSSVAYQLARELHVPTAERTVFLDDVVELGTIRAQMEKLIEAARLRGTAIGIAHPHPETLKVLGEKLPGLRRGGFELVFASELVS